MIPTFILRLWLLGLLALGILGGAAYCGHEGYRRSWGWDPSLRRSFFDLHLGRNEETFLFAAAILLLLIAFAGGPLLKILLRIFKSGKGATNTDDPRSRPPAPTSERRLQRPDGSVLNVQFYGRPDAPPVVLTHGWGLDGSEWNYLKRDLTDRFRLIIWDEPGLGRSKPPNNRDFSMEKLARDLDAVLALAGGPPALLVGHSIGGMITLTFCRLFPESLKTRVLGLLLTHTTYTDPVRTTKGAAFFSAIETAVLKPLMYLTIGLSPILWLLNWLSYWNGSAHLFTKRSSFAGTETWEQLDFAARFQVKACPAVLARGMLGMMKYDATDVLPHVSVPVMAVAADQDSTTLPEASERIRAGVPRARLATLAPAKHLGLIEHHRRYADVVREFAHFALAQSVRPADVAAGPLEKVA